MAEILGFVCTTCGKQYPLDTRDWQCTCGGLFDLGSRPAFDPGQIDRQQSGLWRYRALYPLRPAWQPVSLGEGGTPLLQIDWHGQPVHLKLESLAPTGSFKDRGASLLVTAIAGLGIRRVVEDSSGNAGASLAAYAACAGIDCEVCVPASASGPKLSQMAACGAEVIEIKGRRQYAALAAWAAAAHGAYYASHVYNPYFLVGVESLAYELWEQGAGQAPDALLVPTGNGTLFLGLYRGFQRLHRAGLIDHLPRLFAVQAAACAPLHHTFARGSTEIERPKATTTVASGIAIAQPARGQEILTAVRDSGGAVLAVTEEEIEQAHRQLRLRGLYVEPTSATALAALTQVAKEPPFTAGASIAIPVTGHGLKV